MATGLKWGTDGLFCAGFAPAQRIPGHRMPVQQVVALRNALVIDGTGSPAQEHVSLLLRNGKIEQVGGSEMLVPAGAQVSDLTGKTVMPGLISA